jgi:hypothetical protein
MPLPHRRRRKMNPYQKCIARRRDRCPASGSRSCLESTDGKLRLAFRTVQLVVVPRHTETAGPPRSGPITAGFAIPTACTVAGTLAHSYANPCHLDGDIIIFNRSCKPRLCMIEDTFQPSLSRQIAELEMEVGVKLLERRARGVTLTAAGRVFLDHARLALLQVDTAAEAARMAERPGKPVFVVGFLIGQEVAWLPETLRLLREAAPELEVMILSQSSPELASALMLRIFQPQCLW